MIRFPWNQCSSICKDLRLPSGPIAINCSRSAKRSGKSVWRSATTSPRSPLVLATRATTTSSSSSSLNDVEYEPPVFLQPRGVNQRAQSPHSASLFPDYLAHVTAGDAHLDTSSSVAFYLAHVHCVRLI